MRRGPYLITGFLGLVVSLLLPGVGPRAQSLPPRTNVEPGLP